MTLWWDNNNIGVRTQGELLEAGTSEVVGTEECLGLNGRVGMEEGLVHCCLRYCQSSQLILLKNRMTVLRLHSCLLVY